jgi:hypothetical protein
MCNSLLGNNLPMPSDIRKLPSPVVTPMGLKDDVTGLYIKISTFTPKGQVAEWLSR